MQHRLRRVEESIREALAEIIQRDLRDPRLPVIFNITTVRVTADLSEARVYYTQMPDDDAAIDETQKALEGASGFLRTSMGKLVKLRIVPSLKFFYDDIDRKARRLNQVFAEAHKDEARRKAEAEQAE